VINQRPWGRSKPDDAETTDEVKNLYIEWQRTRPGATVHQFWLAVSSGEIDIPGCSAPMGD